MPDLEKSATENKEFTPLLPVSLIDVFLKYTKANSER